MLPDDCSPFAALPARAHVVDVSARDGLQSVATILSAAQRAQWLRCLLDAGVPEVEAGSFVNPKMVPQMADTGGVLARLEDQAGRLWVLVPNRRGLDDALAAGARNLVFILSATETHSRNNLGRNIATVLRDLEELCLTAAAARVRCRASLSMVWVDPDEGVVAPEVVRELCTALEGLGVHEVTLCDTYGGASPTAVYRTVLELRDRLPSLALGLHLHDTFGFAAAATLAGLMAGVTRFDAAVGGIGGCPFAPGARGNMNTEHLVGLLHAIGAATGIDRERLGAAAAACSRQLGSAAPASPAGVDS